MNKEQRIKTLLSKLAQPLHIEYICIHILKCDVFECIEILGNLVEEGIIEEKNKYYQIKTKK